MGGATNRSGAVKWDIPTLDEELRQMLRDKDMVIRRKDEEYLKLREILDETQTEYQDMLELNSKYLDIIRQLNHMQVRDTGRDRAKRTYAIILITIFICR